MVRSPSVLQQLQALWRELPGLLADRVDLLGLELQRASLALIQIVLLVLACGILGVTAWLVLWFGLIVALVSLGLPMAWALLLVLVLNAGAAWWAMERVRRLLLRLTLPGTRRHLGSRTAAQGRHETSEFSEFSEVSEASHRVASEITRGNSGPALADLGIRTTQAEERLVARQDRLRAQLRVLGEDAKLRLRPQNILAPAAAGVGSLLSLWWLVRRRKTAPSALAWPRGPLQLPGSAGGSATVPWLRMLSLAGPLWPIARKLFSRMPVGSTARPESGRTPLLALNPLQASRWAGRWLEVAATPVREASQTPVAVDVHYLLRHDGSFDLVRRSIDTHGRQRTVRAIVHPVPGSGGGQMRLCRWPVWLRPLPLAWDEHAVLHVDEDYAAALVGQSGGGSFALLLREGLREGDLLQERIETLLRLARDRGYAVDRLRFTGKGRAGP